MKIEKKVWPEYFEKILTGEKKFELRLADWQCQAGDEGEEAKVNSENVRFSVDKFI